MNAIDDEDVKLLRASAVLLSDLGDLLAKLVRPRKHDYTTGIVRQRLRKPQIEPFQEDPQLLDSHLKTFVPPLVAAYLETLKGSARPKYKKGYIPLSHALCRILNLLCKVRGEKVIKGFLNNEPRYLEPILLEFEQGSNFVPEADEDPSQLLLPWTERYVLLLWLSHLMLAPFPLASMSTLESTKEASFLLGVDLPPEIPGITLRVLHICVKGVQSATKERGAAANLLVRLCVRPDMQKLGLLESLVKWSLSFFAKMSESKSDIHQCLGMLSFLSGLVASATNEEIGPFLPAIHNLCQTIFGEGNLAFVTSSAVARKLVIKTLRNIVLHCFKTTSTPNGLDTTTVIEEVIEIFLEALGDGDSPVRYAASKALSIITMKLESEMAAEVAEAILGSLSENVYWQGKRRNLSGVDPLRWHGLTLTLSHLLYRRALSITQLPDILNALLLALTFEQRSATGGSIGTNVRDAACFGIWALSRRYSTKDLLTVDTSSVRASEHYESLPVPQVLAIELLVVACLDPAGNIRRGSSAALQELIGRHPNTVEQGIPLVQVVDFHAVGLRERAMCEISVKAGQLHQMYWEALFESLLSWRGIGSLDASSREYAAAAVGSLSKAQSTTVVQRMAERICDDLTSLKPREVEERQGLVLSLSVLIDKATRPDNPEGATASTTANLTSLWKLFQNVLTLDDKSFTSPALRPEYTASSICSLLGAVAQHSLGFDTTTFAIPTDQIIRLLNLSLGRHEDSVLNIIPKSASFVLRLLAKISLQERDALVSDWLARLENEASYNGLRCSGFAIALGAAYPLLENLDVEAKTLRASPEQARIVEVLTFRCTAAVAIEARTVALKALEILLKHSHHPGLTHALPENVKEQLANALHIALNDYTVTERGDVGALVRLEALTTMGTTWATGLLRGSCREEELSADVIRLSLEKLDKVRARAAQILENEHESLNASIGAIEGISSYAYFSNALKALKPSNSPEFQEALCLGFVISAGMGSESVVQNSRAALLDTIDLLPTSRRSSGSEPVYSLLEMVECLTNILKTNLENERILIPLLEVIAFLLDMQVIHRLLSTSFNFRVLLSLTQKAHFKSTHMQKLVLALDVYRGLGTITPTRADTITKVTNMLLHPFPKIRITAAETLWVLTQEEELKRHDWSLPSKSLKPAVESIKKAIDSATTSASK